MSNWKIIVAEATTNLITNPSFEVDTTGWSAGSNWTLTRSTNISQFGIGSGRVQSSASAATTLASFAITLPTTSTDYTISGWVRVAAGWDGGNIRWNVGSMSGASASHTAIYTDGTSSTNVLLYLESTITVASDVTGTIVLETTSAPGASKVVFFDAVQVEEKSYATTYCDGDQDGCRWVGAEHNSESKRLATTWQGGRVRDLVDDYGLRVQQAIGAGVAPVVTNTTDYALAPGGDYQNSRTPSRVWSLTGSFQGTTQADLRSKRQALGKILSPKRFGGSAPVRLRYTGAAEEKEIDAIYAGGLEGGNVSGHMEATVPLRFVSTNPHWYGIGHSAKVVDSNDSATFRLIAGYVDGQWTPMGPPISGGTYNSAKALAVIGSYLYIGGDFSAWDGQPTNNITRWNLTSLSYATVGTAVNGVVNDFFVDTDGSLWVVGNFTTAGGSTARGIARWVPSTTTWDVSSNPSSGSNAETVVVDRSGHVWVGGNFTNWDGIANADYIVYWDGSSWVAPTTGANARVRGMHRGLSGNPWIVGDFTSIGGVTVSGVARWSGVYSRPGTVDLLGTSVNCVTVGTNGRAYVGGTLAGGNYFALWNGTDWEFPSVQPNGAVTKVEWDDATGRVYLTGAFTDIGDDSGYNGIAYWDGSSYGKLDIDMGSSPNIDALLINNGDVYITPRTTGTVNYAATTTVTHNGSGNAYPIIYIQRTDNGAVEDAVLWSIRNQTTGKQMLFAREVYPGETITINLQPGERNMRSTAWGATGFQTLTGSDVGDWVLAPGDNKIQMYVSTAGSAAITAWMRWRDTYEGLD